MPLRRRLETYFEFQALGATWKTEILAGLTTFMTMAYIQVRFWNIIISSDSLILKVATIQNNGNPSVTRRA
jgi:xanthine/uracil/vitamin C permease (AzgA family)